MLYMKTLITPSILAGMNRLRFQSSEWSIMGWLLIKYYMTSIVRRVNRWWCEESFV